VKCQWLIGRVLDLSFLFLGSYLNASELSTDYSLCQNCQYNFIYTAKLIPYEQLFIQTFHHNGDLIDEQSATEHNPLFHLVKCT